MDGSATHSGKDGRSARPWAHSGPYQAGRIERLVSAKYTPCVGDLEAYSAVLRLPEYSTTKSERPSAPSTTAWRSITKGFTQPQGCFTISRPPCDQAPILAPADAVVVASSPDVFATVWPLDSRTASPKWSPLGSPVVVCCLPNECIVFKKVEAHVVHADDILRGKSGCQV